MEEHIQRNHKIMQEIEMTICEDSIEDSGSDDELDDKIS
jgi:hypothetical protein